MTNPQAAQAFVTPIAGTAGEFEYVTGDCAIDSDEVIHIFFAFAGGSCDLEPLISYATGGGDTWRSYGTPYRGWVLGMAVDGNRRFLLFVNSSGVHIGEMAGDQFAQSLAVSSQPADWQFSSGDVVASNGRWWAVWSERANPSQPFQMFQASTMAASSDLPLHVGSKLPNVLHNAVPSLTLDPTGPDNAVLAWMVVLNDFSSVVRLAQAHTSNAIWHEQAWAPPSPQPGRNAGGPDLFAGAGELYSVYGDDDTITYVRDPPSGTVSTQFQAAGYTPRVAHSDGRTWVAWRDTDDQVVLGEPPAATSVRLKPGPNGSTQRLIGLLASQGQVTVVGVDFADQSLWAAET